METRADGLLTEPGRAGPDGLRLLVERIEPTTVPTGRGALLYLEGWCFHPERRIARLEAVVGSHAHRATAFPYSRPDVADALREDRALYSGFCSIVPVVRSIGPGEHQISLRVTLEGGDVSLIPCGSFTVESEPPPAAHDAAGPQRSDTAPLIAICMATFNPDKGLIGRQVETIRAQTYERFVCLVNDDASDPGAWEWIKSAVGDDPRFLCSRNAERLGFYRNFERCLSLVPSHVEYVALADQDDVWHPDKLATLAEAMRDDTVQLAYSDMNIVTATGALIASTAWADRPNNFTQIGSLLMINTVTGAASLFRRELLDDILPFPPNVGLAFHDHWIACVALALGDLAYVDRPLYDYVQHDSNTVGHATDTFKSGMLHLLLRFMRNPLLRFRNTIALSRELYLTEVVRMELIGRTLEFRLGGRIAPDRADDVRRVARLSSSPRSLGWLLGRSVRDVRGGSVTLGLENQIAKGILWRYYQMVRARLARP
jgi:glycosyltransferase involved in cell wall biosynthesis